MNKQKGLALSLSKGFTIIELIVVIAIIAVLAAIVLANVTGFINKGKDAAAEGNLSSLMTIATTFYSNNGTYTGLGDDPSVLSVGHALINAGYAYTNITFEATATNWCTSIELKVKASDNNLQYYCADSTGAKYMSETTACQISGDGDGSCSP